MSNQSEKPLQVVFVVTCFQNIVGVFADQQDATIAQNDLIQKNRPADILCRPIVYPLKASSK